MGSPDRVTVVMLVGYLLAMVVAPGWHHHDHRPCDVPPSIGELSCVTHDHAVGKHGADHRSTCEGYTPHDPRQNPPAPLPCPSDDNCLICQCIAQSALPAATPVAQQLQAPINTLAACLPVHLARTALSLPPSRAPPAEA